MDFSRTSSLQEKPSQFLVIYLYITPHGYISSSLNVQRHQKMTLLRKNAGSLRITQRQENQVGRQLISLQKDIPKEGIFLLHSIEV